MIGGRGDRYVDWSNFMCSWRLTAESRTGRCVTSTWMTCFRSGTELGKY